MGEQIENNRRLQPTGEVAALAPQNEPLVPAETSARAAAISKALNAMARRAARIGVRRSWRQSAKRQWSSFTIGVVAGFVALVVVPAIAGSVYFGVIASRQFVSEMSFAVRSPSATSDLLGGLGALANSQRTQDALIIADYIRSRRMFEDLDRDIGLKARYARPNADWFSRMDADDPIEDLVKYWRSKVYVKVDKNSGTVSVTAKAFTPEDALVIAKGIEDRSERLANELSERARNDVLRQAEEELGRTERAVLTTIDAVRRTRNDQGILDATRTAEALTKVISELRGKLLLLESEYAVQGKSVAPSAPQMKILASQVASLKGQIAGLERRIAGESGSTTLADTQGALDRRALDVKVTEQQYATAAAKFEQARLDQASKQVYLMTYVSPRLAEDALYPKRMLIICLVLLSGLALWGSVVGVAVTVRDHMAV